MGINPSTLCGIESFPNLVLPTSLSSHYSVNLQDFFLFPQHARFINTPKSFCIYFFLHGTFLPRLYQGCLPFSIQISSQMSFIQESISLPVIQSHSHLSSGSACHISLFNYINRVYHCDEKQLVYFCRVNNSPFELLT